MAFANTHDTTFSCPLGEQHFGVAAFAQSQIARQWRVIRTQAQLASNFLSLATRAIIGLARGV